MFDVFHKLTTSSLRQLSDSLRDGELASGITSHAIQQIAGASLTEELVKVLENLSCLGWSSSQLSDFVKFIADTREQASKPESVFDLVLSGPDVQGIPTRDTAAVMHSLIEQANEEVILVGYAVHNGKKLFERLAQRMEEQPKLNVWFCLNIQRQFRDTSLSSEIVRRFSTEFQEKHWPWSPKPQVFYDPRSLDDKGKTRTSLHAKCLIVDREQALITSANFTEAAQKRNIEAGVVVRYKPFVERITLYFDMMKQSIFKELVFPN